MPFLTDVRAQDVVILECRGDRLGVRIKDENTLILEHKDVRIKLTTSKRRGQKIRLSIEAGDEVRILKNQRKKRRDTDG